MKKEFAKRALQLVAAVTFIGGGYVGWIQPGETTQGESCSNLRKSVINLERDLFAKGTLGDSCLFCSLEVRNPDDIDSLKRLGSLKNERDRVCNINKKDWDEPIPTAARYTALAGLIGLLFSATPKRD